MGAKDYVSRIMSTTLSNPLAAVFNWHGKGAKRGIGNLMFAKAVKGEYNRLVSKRQDV